MRSSSDRPCGSITRCSQTGSPVSARNACTLPVEKPANTRLPSTTGEPAPRSVSTGTWVSNDHFCSPVSMSRPTSRPSDVCANASLPEATGAETTSLETWARQRSAPSAADNAITSARDVPISTSPSPAPTPPITKLGSRFDVKSNMLSLSGLPIDTFHNRLPLKRSRPSTSPYASAANTRSASTAGESFRYFLPKPSPIDALQTGFTFTSASNGLSSAGASLFSSLPLPTHGNQPNQLQPEDSNSAPSRTSALLRHIGACCIGELRFQHRILTRRPGRGAHDIGGLRVDGGLVRCGSTLHVALRDQDVPLDLGGDGAETVAPNCSELFERFGGRAELREYLC